jgi:hypothetical protein
MNFFNLCMLRLLMTQHKITLCIPLTEQVVSVVVTCTTSSVKKYCRIKLEHGKAVISHGWNKVVEAFNLKEKDVDAW